MPLRNKYPIESWITDREMIAIGDTVAYYSDEEQLEIVGEVISFPSASFTQYISCRRIDKKLTEVINIYNTIVYKIGNREIVMTPRTCSCGSKFTSNPNYHLNYCDLAHSH